MKMIINSWKTFIFPFTMYPRAQSSDNSQKLDFTSSKKKSNAAVQVSDIAEQDSITHGE
jgi:hypothetical protein